MVRPATWLLLLGVVCCTCTLEPEIEVDHTAPQEQFLDQCTPVPTWTIGGDRAVNLIGKNITVVALLNSSRLFGRKQAARLSSLRNRFYQAGFPDINFFVINSILATDNTDLLRNEAVNIPVYQEQPEAPVRDILGAENDHILVLDRCGRMAYQVITPFSKLIYPYVKAAILSTYKDNPCGFCNNTHAHDLYRTEQPTILNYASDEPVHDDCMFCNTLTKSVTNPDLEPYYREINQSHSIDHIQVQKSNQSTAKNQLTQLFFENVTEPKDDSEVTGLQLRAISGDLYHNNNVANMAPFRRSDEPTSMISASVMPELQVPTRNWNWFDHQKSADEVNSSESGDIKSVEVVHQVENSFTRKKKKTKDKRKDRTTDNQIVREPFPNYTTDSSKLQKCQHNALVQEIFLDSNSQEIVNDSMEVLVNQTQRLFDWYQRQIENGTSSEEEYEKSNILKERIIEHYSRLLPWLNFKLTPENI